MAELILYIVVIISLVFLLYCLFLAITSSFKKIRNNQSLKKQDEKRNEKENNKIKVINKKSFRPVKQIKEKEIVKTTIRIITEENKGFKTKIENVQNDVQEVHFFEGNEEENVVTARISKDTGKMILIRYKKSFQARLNLAEDINKDYYSQIKNKLLSYKKVKSRISWNYDAFNLGRNQLSKLNIRGKTLFLYLPLDPNDYIDSKYSFKDCSEIKKYENLPFRLKIKSDRGLKNAFELIELIMLNSDADENPKFEETNYYEKNRGFAKLLDEGLIKEVIDNDTFNNLTEINKDFLDSNNIVSISLDKIKDVSISEEIYTQVTNTISQRVVINGKGAIVNVDTISNMFDDGDVVSINSLINKNLVAKNAKSVKILARGTLNKKLVFDVDAYSKDAIKMILITGGSIK